MCGVNQPSVCSASGIRKRGAIEPPIAARIKKAKVETGCACSRVLHAAASARAIPALAAAAQTAVADQAAKFVSTGTP